MPDLEIIPPDPAFTLEILEIVRRREGFETIEQTADFLLAMAVRKGVKALVGRGPALHAVERKPTQ
jgi:hypothetical protein